METESTSLMERPAEPAQERSSRRYGAGTVLVWAFVLGLLAVLGLGLVRSQQGPVGVGTEAPVFKLTTFDGQSFDTAALRGQVIVVNFWASWCKPCEQEAAELEQASRIFRDAPVIFLGVNYVDTEREALAYIDRFDITYPNGPDLGTRISQAFRIRGVPETYIIGPDGRIVQLKIGPFGSLDEIVDMVESALGR